MVNCSQFTTGNFKQTKRVAAVLAREILKTKPSKAAILLALEGDLGSGKTTFLQGLAKGLGIHEKILSPTFIIFRKFKLRGSKFLPRRQAGKFFYHFDCYRLKSPKEILELGFKEIIANPQNIVAVEWSEKIKTILPKNKITLKFEFINPVRDSEDKKKGRRKQISNGVDKNKRQITIK